LLKILLVRINDVEYDILEEISNGLVDVYKDVSVKIDDSIIPPPEEAYVPSRDQYIADYFLIIARKVAEEKGYHRVLAVTNLNIYSRSLNFVFGIACLNCRGAVISLYMLNPEVYRRPFNRDLFIERAIKEAVHELGHTLGFSHCSNPKCVMRFSNSIIEVDYKSKYFCDRCSVRLKSIIKTFQE